MKKRLTLILIALLLLSGCAQEKIDDDTLVIVSSYTIITDMLQQIAEDKIVIYNLVPTGTDPHEYEPLPKDIKYVSDADLMFYNGVNLEGGENGWFFKLLKSVDKDIDQVINLSEGIEPLYLYEGNETEDMINPHAYLNPKNGIIMVENILNALVDKDPTNENFYKQNAQIYIEKLTTLENLYRDQFGSLNENDKTIVTSERAFQYMNKEYGIEEGYIWAIDTEETGTAAQIKELSNFIKEKDVKILFLESNVDTRPMETVSKETQVPIFKDKVFSDEIGKKGSEVDTYEKLLTHNLSVFMEGLSEYGSH
ncbi:MAG TPA: zinc ABC transporter substrate-binding protein [Erysipelothrix sp.]|nr:zinc ABC transporter substrate-binding protein [Erysipelothrix sp.]